MNDMSDVLYVMAALVLFSILATNSNAAFVRNANLQVESELEFNAIAVAQSIIDEARVKAFDENDIVNNPNELDDEMPVFSQPSVLGPESGEVYPNFDDFDDFDGLSFNRNTGYGNFTVTAEVVYVNTVNLIITTIATTTRKRLTVTVSHSNLPNDVTLIFYRTYY
jgi:hypothetical protein